MDWGLTGTGQEGEGADLKSLFTSAAIKLHINCLLYSIDDQAQ